MEPPDPHQIANVLREQLRLLRALIQIEPDCRAYPVTAELVTRAILQLDKQSAVPAR